MATKPRTLLSPVRYLFGQVPKTQLAQLTPDQRTLLNYQALSLVLFGLCALLTLILAVVLNNGQAAAWGQWLQ